MTPSRAQPIDQVVEPLRFVLRQAAGRLVEDDDPRAAADRRGDLHHLLLTDRQLAHQPPDVDLRAGRGQHLLRAPHHLAPRHERRRRRQRAEAEVFGDGQVVAERELLMDDADAGLEGGLRDR